MKGSTSLLYKQIVIIPTFSLAQHSPFSTFNRRKCNVQTVSECFCVDCSICRNLQYCKGLKFCGSYFHGFDAQIISQPLDKAF